MRLRKRNGVWHARYWENGERRERSTQCTDRRAAEAVAAQFERDAADPDHARTRDATLNDAFALLLADRRERARKRTRSQSTVDFYQTKCGHWLRLYGHEFPLSRITSRLVREYIETRRTEPRHAAAKKRPAPVRMRRNGRPVAKPRPVKTPPRVTESTIAKELIALRAALKLAVVEGIWKGDPRAVVPVAFSPAYEPRTRWLPRAELGALFGVLAPDEAARVAFAVATSAERSVLDRASPLDVAADRSRVHVRGTKRVTRDRLVPILATWQRELLAYALEHAQGTDGLLFAPWQNDHRALARACVRAGIARISWNDLRRTFAQFLRADGVPLELIAPMMGHASTAMLQRVYGRLDADTLAVRLAMVLCPTGAPPSSESVAEMAAMADGAKRDRPQKNQTETGGPSGTRTLDRRIKSPPAIWPAPGRKAHPRKGAKTRAPRVPHVAAAKGRKS
jgi:integrase